MGDEGGVKGVLAGMVGHGCEVSLTLPGRITNGSEGGSG